MDFEVPLNRLKFGQEDGAGINARVTGRQDSIPELAANLHARGQIENLVVKKADGDFYAVSNGNRRLAAFHMIYGETSSQPIRCTLRDVDEDGAFEDSLTTAVTAKQLHPVDQYEAFARLRDRAGKTVEEIARQYGMSEREVDQALALGHLSPKIREAWRKGEIKASAAKAFTLAPDHKTQDKLLDDLKDDAVTGRGCDLSEVEADEVKQLLKIGNDNSGTLVEFVGVENYIARGGKVTRDLFGVDHKVSDAKLAKAMAAERLAQECAALKKCGWSFAVTTESVRNSQYSYGRLAVKSEPSAEEKQKLAELEAIFNPGGSRRYYEADSLAQLTGVQQQAYLDHRELQRSIELRAYPPSLMAKAGCFVGIDDDGLLEIEYGRVKPAAQKEAAKEVQSVKRQAAKAPGADGKPAAAPTTISNALRDRMETQLIAATRDAIAEEACGGSSSPLTELLAKIICAQIDPERPFHMPDKVRTKLPSIRQVLGAATFNEAIAKRFDVADYFGSAPKGLVLKAIGEGINPDEARKVAAKTKAEIGKFAIANMAKTGWLPKELRTVHYAGPGSEGFKKPAGATASESRSEPKADEKTTVLPPKAAARPKAKAAPVKRAAAAKKTASKTSAQAKKRPAKKRR